MYLTSLKEFLLICILMILKTDISSLLLKTINYLYECSYGFVKLVNQCVKQSASPRVAFGADIFDVRKKQV